MVGRQGWDTTLTTLGPLALAAKEGAARAAMLDGKRGGSKTMKNRDKSMGPMMSITSTTTTESKNSSGHGTLYALLATGMAVGAAGALMARRRMRAQWAEYEPSSLNSDASSFQGAGATSKSFGESSSAGVSKVTNWTKSAVDGAKHKMHHGSESGQGGSNPATGDQLDDEVDDLIRAAKNGRM